MGAYYILRTVKIDNSNMHNLTKDNLLGRVFLNCLASRPIDGYFTCLNLIRPLLENSYFQSLIAGFYINVGYNFSSVRLSYFTNDKEGVKKVIEDFLNNNSDLKLIKFDEARKENFSKDYGGTELEFRKFLHTYTQIGLDLLDYDILYSRRLVAEYRLTYSPQRISCKPLFEPAFRNHSKFFNQLDSSSVGQLWKDLDYWYPGGDWTHMLVNMLLPGDWIYMNEELKNFFLNPDKKPPITGIQKNDLLKKFNLDIPNDWSP